MNTATKITFIALTVAIAVLATVILALAGFGFFKAGVICGIAATFVSIVIGNIGVNANGQTFAKLGPVDNGVNVNPATGLPMVGGTDVQGNPFGANLDK